MYDDEVDDLLAALRRDLDLRPSPVPDRPGLLVRDPFRYSDVVLIIPPPCFAGSLPMTLTQPPGAQQREPVQAEGQRL